LATHTPSKLVGLIGVTCAPGHNVAREVLNDLGVRRRWSPWVAARDARSL